LSTEFFLFFEERSSSLGVKNISVARIYRKLTEVIIEVNHSLSLSPKIQSNTIVSILTPYTRIYEIIAEHRYVLHIDTDHVCCISEILETE
jgi:predicted DCC family thiol-disulfide oxidoreductase YuxK